VEKVIIIGAGLAGSEAAWQVAKRGVPVELYEMRPVKMTPAHHTDQFAELVCSNSFRAAGLENAVGLLKEEMRRLDSLIMRCADEYSVPAGGALAVDRHLFSKAVTEILNQHPMVKIFRKEITKIPEKEIVIVATGPLTSDALAEEIKLLTGAQHLHFYDAAAPIVAAESIDFSKVYWASRYGKGDADYLNCAMNKEEYDRFYHALIEAETVQLKDFEEGAYFEGCMPIEVMAKRGYQTLLFGPLKPVGLTNPYTGKMPFAVVQLRKENREGTMFNLVGFQTSLKWPEQKRVFRLIPGLENAEFIRMGVIHRNTFIISPTILRRTLQMKSKESIFFAGQITGVEGYLESASNGIIAGINGARLAKGLEPVAFPLESAIGALSNYIVTADPKSFQPMNVAFGLLPALSQKIKDKKQKKLKIAERALEAIEAFKNQI
jgi:methylenetetrahydrofolate--tRNA-(uracil-5-)-methyltransferase